MTISCNLVEIKIYTLKNFKILELFPNIHNIIDICKISMTKSRVLLFVTNTDFLKMQN